MGDLLNVVERSATTCCWPRSSSPARTSAPRAATRPPRPAADEGLVRTAASPRRRPPD